LNEIKTENRKHYNCIHNKCDGYPCILYIKRSATKCPCWAPKLPPKPKGIYIEMGCGDKYHLNTTQPTIKSVHLHGEQVYPPIRVMVNPKNQEEVCELLALMSGRSDWKCLTNTSNPITSIGTSRSVHDTFYKKYYPPTIWEYMAVPSAWHRDGSPHPSEGFYSVYGRKLTGGK